MKGNSDVIFRFVMLMPAVLDEVDVNQHVEGDGWNAWRMHEEVEGGRWWRRTNFDDADSDEGLPEDMEVNHHV